MKIFFFLLLLFNCIQSFGYKLIHFNGGGIFFWYQSGCCQYLQEHGFLEHAMTEDMKIMGTSAGSLSAALLASNADFNQAADYAIFQAKRDRLLETKKLAFVWGSIVNEWLDEIIPEGTEEEKELNPLIKNNLMISVTPLSSLRQCKPCQKILRDFEDKADVINACMASCHIPLFMDKKPSRKYRGERYIDGSFWPFILGHDRFNKWTSSSSSPKNDPCFGS